MSLTRTAFAVVLISTLAGCNGALATSKSSASNAPSATLPSVTTAALATATVAVPYSATLAATGGTPPYTWSLLSGTLPPGLTLAVTGTISGTAATATTATFTVTIKDRNGQTAVKTLTLVVSPASTSGLAIQTQALPGGTVGSPYTATLLVSGGTPPITWGVTSGSLPAGLTLDPTTGAISGTPTAATTAPFTVTATDATGATASTVLAITVTAGSTPGGGTWVDFQTPRLPTQMAMFGAASVQNVVYTFGGFTQSGGPSSTILRYDPAAQTIAAEPATLPTPIAYTEVCSLNGKLYVFGGSDNAQAYDTAFSYDPTTKTLTPLASMPEARDSLASAGVGTDIYIFGGAHLDLSSFDYDGTNTIWKYSTTSDTWTTLGTTMPDIIQWAKAIALNGKIYVIGGCSFEVVFPSTQETLANYPTCFEFDPASQTLTAMAPMPVATKFPVGDVINGTIYVCSGDTTTGVQNNAALWAYPSPHTFAFDPVANAWTTLADFTTNIPGVGPFGGRALAGAAAANGKLYLLGGLTLPQPNMTVPPAPTSQGIVDGIAEFTP
jgi:N-acetylneuraminic acid mutarotase